MKDDLFKEPDSWFNAVSTINKGTQFEIKDLIKAGQEIIDLTMKQNLEDLELWRQIGKKKEWENIFCLVPFAYFKKYIVDNIVKVIMQDWYRVEEHKSIKNNYYTIDYIPVKRYLNSNCQIVFDQLIAPMQSLHFTLEKISNRYSYTRHYKDTEEDFGYGSHISNMAKFATIKAITEKVEKEFFNWHFLQDNYFHVVRDMFNNGAPKGILKDFLLGKGIENQKADKLLYFWLIPEEEIRISDWLDWLIPNGNAYHQLTVVCPIITIKTIENYEIYNIYNESIIKSGPAIKLTTHPNIVNFHNHQNQHYRKVTKPTY